MMLIQIVKMWWMFTWRSSLVLTIIFRWDLIPMGILISLGLAVAIGLTGRTLKIMPLLAIIAGVNPLVTFEENAKPYVKPADGKPAQTAEETIDRATNNGVMTGFEPKALENVKYYRGTRMFGVPGAGLSSSGFSSTAIELGQKGEENFARALYLQKHKDGGDILNKFDSFWSVAMPSLAKADEADKELQTDIDAIIVVNNTIYLIDLKNYAGGDVIYRTEDKNFITIDRASGKFVGKHKHMSTNMLIALNRFKTHFPGKQIQARVVLMPTDKGEGVIENAIWPGKIPAVNLRDFLAELSSKTVETNSPYESYIISKLVKKG